MALLLAVSCLVPAAGQAMVTDLQGKATITQGGRTMPASILTEVTVGSQIQVLAEAALVVLYLDSGAEFSIKGPAQIVVRQTQPEALSGAPPVRRASVLWPAIRVKPVGLGQAAIVMRSLAVNNPIRLLTASSTRVLDKQPELRWQEPQGGLKYQVEIADDTGRILHEAQVDGVALVVPDSLQLKDGQAYSWAVSARLPDGRRYAGTGNFSVASAELRAQANGLAAAAGTDVSSRVSYGVWLDQAGLKDEARMVWRVLAAERPDDEQLKARALR